MADFKYLVSVITPDKVGLTSDIARTIVDLKGNISDMRQTIVSGFFSLIFVTNHSEDVHDVLRASLEKVLPAGAELSIMENPEAALHSASVEGTRYVAITSGVDRPGMMLAISSFMATHKINIEDWSTVFDGNRVTHLAYVTFHAPCTDLKTVQIQFKQAMAEVGFTAQICHEDIFRATGEIAPIKTIL